MRSTMPPICAGETGAFDVLAFLVQAAEQLVDDPVGGQLAVAALGDRLEIVGALALGDVSTPAS
jgi:hypothetical protein